MCSDIAESARASVLEESAAHPRCALKNSYYLTPRRKSHREGAPKNREVGAGRRIALAVARALHWLHTNGIVHGDLRPSKGAAPPTGRKRILQ